MAETAIDCPWQIAHPLAHVRNVDAIMWVAGDGVTPTAMQRESDGRVVVIPNGVIMPWGEADFCWLMGADPEGHPVVGALMVRTNGRTT